jgi:hypothetical protein
VIRAIKQKGIVGKEGKIEIHSTEPEEGTDLKYIKIHKRVKGLEPTTFTMGR